MTPTVTNAELALLATDLMLKDFRIFLQWVKTFDEADDIWDEYYPTHLEYLQYLADDLQHGDNDPLWIPKSRRLMVTWTLCAWLLWRACRSKAFHGFIQSKRETDSAFFVEHRIGYIWDRLPYWFKFCVCGGPPVVGQTHMKFEIPSAGKIWGVPQGSSVFAGYTPSALFVDEAEKQPEFEDAVATIMPFAEKKTKLVFVSSAEGNYFGDVVSSAPATEPKEPLKGLKTWKLESGGRVLQIHYSADPDKTTPEWFALQERNWPGGTKGWKFRQEMEIEFHARSGAPVFDMYTDTDPHVIEPQEYFGDDFNPSWFEERYRSIDWGMRNPTACLWFGLLDKEWYIYREFYEEGPTVEGFKDRIKQMSGYFDAKGEWVPEDYLFTIIDPASDRRNAVGMSTVYHLLNTGDNKIFAIKANRSDDGIQLIKEWLHQNRLHIFSECRHTRWEVKNYRYQEWSPGTQVTHNLKETPIDKDNHAVDTIKYLANLVRPKENLWRTKANIQTIDMDPEIVKLLTASRRQTPYRGKIINAY